MNIRYWRYKVLKHVTWGKLHDKYSKKYRNLKLERKSKLERGFWDISGENNKVILFTENEEFLLTENSYSNLYVKINGKNNYIRINKDELSNNKLHVSLTIDGNDNNCIFSHRNCGKYLITMLGDNNLFKVGCHTECGDFSIALHCNHFEIGRDCMISALEELWTDGHSVIDYETKELLNLPKSKVLIGDHVWLGRRVTLTKGAQIPDDCIVGIGSVVTKKFTEPHCVIAGNPAKVVRRGISWHGMRPDVYQKQYSVDKVTTGDK